MQPDPKMRALFRYARTVDAFTAWLCEYSDELLEAVELLGGRYWMARAAQLVTLIQQGAHPAHHLAELRAIRRLLHLDHAGRPGSVEESRLAEIHPDDPRADNARLCAEARALTLRAGHWLALLRFRTRPGAPRFLPGMRSYHDMLDPAAPDERRHEACLCLLPAAERQSEIERWKSEEALAARSRHDPHGVQWRMTERGAALEAIAGLLRNAVERHRASEAN